MSGIGDYFEDPMKTYSSGMKSRVSFTLSMAFDFDYFLLDEITAVGDKLFRKTALEALATKREHSKVLMVSHQMHTCEFCDSGILRKQWKNPGSFQKLTELSQPTTRLPKNATALDIWL